MEQFLLKLKELLADVEGVDFVSIETELKDLVAKDPNTVTMTAKNKELISKVKTLEKEINSLKDQYKNIDIDEYNRLIDEEAKRIIDPNQKSNLDDIKSKIELKYKVQLDAKENELKSLRDELKNSEDAINEMLVSSAIDEQFTTGKKVIEAHRAILKGYFRNKVKVEKDGNERILYVLDNGQEMPIKDYFDYWKNLEDSKTYIESTNTSGGGNTGSNKGSFKKNTKTWSEMSPAERVELYKTSPVEYNRLKNEKK